MAGLVESLAGRPVVRRLADAAFSRDARRRVAQLDRLDVAAVQANTLRRLLRGGRRTRFGRDHDFARLRTTEDYQRRVPLRTYEQFWRDYWQSAFPRLENVTWPGRIPYLAVSSGTTTGATKHIPVSRAMLASNQRAALAALALFRTAHPKALLFSGKMFFLGGSTDLTPLGKGVLSGDLSGIAAREISPILRPYVFPPLDLALLHDWDQKLNLLAERSIHEPITAVGGVPSWLLALFERVLAMARKDCLAEVWPHLRLILHGGAKFDPYRILFQRLIGSDAVRFRETYPASEGFVAAEDPRHGLLRLLPEHGIFFEFVPVAECEAASPTRHTVANLEPGVQYAIVLTTCAGLWSYVLGDTVCFEKRNPPLLRFTGRTRYYLSAFGEHLISEEVERAVATAAEAMEAEVVDFHVGPVFPDRAGTPGRHRYLVEFARQPHDLLRFTAALDDSLCRANDDYAAHRQGNLTLLPPEIRVVKDGGFTAWMRAHGKLGGQHKVPRMDSTGQLTGELTNWFERKGLLLVVSRS
jgi:hypothetical protein